MSNKLPEPIRSLDWPYAYSRELARASLVGMSAMDWIGENWAWQTFHDVAVEQGLEMAQLSELSGIE